MTQRTVREEELMIEVERLRAWLYKIQNEASKETKCDVIEWLAEQSLVRSHCAAQPDWGHTEDWAPLGVWPPANVMRHGVDMSTSEAFDALKSAIQADDDYAWSWHCNVAMPFVDEGGSHEQANRAAARFMRTCFNMDVTKFDQWNLCGIETGD